MHMIILGLRNLLRSKLRVTIAVVLMGIPIFLLLAMQAISSGVENQTEILKSQVDTLLQLRARGVLGHVNMVGNERLLPDDVLPKLKGIAHVVKVEPYLLAMYPTEGTNFAMHVGVNPGDAKRLESHGEAGHPRIIAGRDFTQEDQGKDVAIIGQGYAKFLGISEDNLEEATLTVNPKTPPHPAIFPLERPKWELKIIGIHASGYVFGDLQLFMPLETFRRIYGIDQGYAWIFVQADSLDHAAAVEEDVRRAVGDIADIISPKTRAIHAAIGIQNLTSLTGIGGILAVILMAVIVFFVMLLLVRERAQEIGTLKAIGASNRDIAVQFLTEAVGLSVLGGLTGLFFFVLLGSSVIGHIFTLVGTPFLPQEYQPLFESLTLHLGISLPLLALVLFTSVLAAVVGSAYGLWQVISLSPLEAIKHHE